MAALWEESKAQIVAQTDGCMRRVDMSGLGIAANSWVNLVNFLETRSGRCAEAGRAFLALQHCRLAADAFAEAASVAEREYRWRAEQFQSMHEDVLLQWIWADFVRLPTVASAAARLRVLYKQHMLHAGICWLLVAHADRNEDKQVALDWAERSFRRACRAPQLLGCATVDPDVATKALPLSVAMFLADE
jgi:hypothetical protein